jgi:hypothetical protein
VLLLNTGNTAIAGEMLATEWVTLVAQQATLTDCLPQLPQHFTLTWLKNTQQMLTMLRAQWYHLAVQNEITLSAFGIQIAELLE